MTIHEELCYCNNMREISVGGLGEGRGEIPAPTELYLIIIIKIKENK